MGKLNAKQVASLAKGDPVKVADGNGLYFIVPRSGVPFWMLRYTYLSKRKEMTLGTLTDLSLADAREKTNELKTALRQEHIDPLAARADENQKTIKIMDQLFEDWYEHDLVKRLEHPHIPARIYRKEISPAIGLKRIEHVTSTHVRDIIVAVNNSGRPTIANDTLMYLKQLFRHAIKLDLTANNPASAFNADDAGGVEKSRERMLTIDELDSAFKVFKEHSDSFTRDNYLACCLLLVLGARKSELCEMQWSELDLDNAVWHLHSDRSKTDVAISIPLPHQALTWLQELKVRSFGSDYVFPNRRRSKKPHMGSDTLNRAISKLFGQEPGRKIPPPNVMGDLEHFTVHDLRRTFRSIAASAGVPGHVGERCLNHKLKGVEGIYDRYDYYDERKEAHQKVADLLEPILSH